MSTRRLFCISANAVAIMSRLTSHLLHLDGQAVEEATQHPFLQATAKNQLDPERLKTWLAQDRLYQQAYINFVGVMLSKVVVPNGGDRATTLQWRAADLLIESLTNIREEMKLFEETAKIEVGLMVYATLSHRCRQDLIRIFLLAPLRKADLFWKG